MNKCEICDQKVKDKRNKCCGWKCRNKRISNLYKGRKFTQQHKDNIKKGHHDVSGDKNPNWNGGKKISSGYVLIWKPKHKYSTKLGYVSEHRLVIEKKLNRYLEPGEVVHHINGIKDDNRIDNLKLFERNGDHIKLHSKSRNNPYLEVVCENCDIKFMKRNSQIKLTKRNFCSRNCFHLKRWGK